MNLKRQRVYEHDEQVLIFQWADLQASFYPELLLLYAIPNGAKLPYRGKGKRRFSKEAIRLLDEGLKPGMLDMCLPVPRKGYHGLYIELKVERNKPTEKQMQWLQQLNAQGYLAVVKWGADAVIRELMEYLDIEGAVI